MKKFFFLQGLILFFSIIHAQKIVIDKVLQAPAGNIAVIKQGSEVKGYFFYYISDKVDKKTNNYTLRIMDNNLNVLRDIEFTDSKEISILESSFNGKDLIFLFYNEKERTFEYQVYGADGDKKFTYSKRLTRSDISHLESTYLYSEEDEKKYKGLYPIEGKGFISNTPSQQGYDLTFQIDFFSTEKRKQWSYTPADKGVRKYTGEYFGVYNNIVLIKVLMYTSVRDGRPEFYIIGLDLETGRQLFQRPTDAEYKFNPVNISVLNGNAYIFGEYYNLNDNIMKAKSLGLGVWQIDGKGNIVTEKYNSWAKVMSNYLNVNSKGKIEDFGYIFLHNVIQTSDGNIHAIGEGFKAHGPLAKLRVTDMILVSFDKDFNVTGVKVYEKTPNNVKLYNDIFNSMSTLGKQIKSNGWFDYEYTQANSDFSSFSVCYSDYVRGKDYKGITFNSISYNEGKFTTDKINTKSDATVTLVVQGQQGQVLLVDYYKKTKKLEAHFEKLN
jgi:hypothetical protein